MLTRIILSGPGLIGRRHVELVEERPDCTLVGIVAPDRPEHVNFAQDIGAAFFSDLSEAFDAVEADGVIISSPNRFHSEQALLCLEKGVPALVEKPVSDSLESARILAEAVEETGVPILVGHHRTYSPLIEVLLDYVNSERFGRMVALQGSALFFKPDHYFDDGPWRMLKGGGPILINMIHEIGLMRTFAGEIRSVQAVASNSQRHFEVEDTVAIALEFESGALGTFILSDAASSSKSWEMTAGENPAYPFFPDEACYHLAGTMGSIDFPSMTVRSYPDAADRSWWKPFELGRKSIQRADPLERQLSHFLDVIRQEAAPRVSAYDGLQNMRVLQALYDAIETKSSVLVS
jgi:predicted dehydrogenase